MDFTKKDLDIINQIMSKSLENQKVLNSKGNQNWQDLLKKYDQLPQSSYINLFQDQIIIGEADECTAEQKEIIIEFAKELIPWRKGPFKLFGIDIEGEWQSNLKWSRIEQSGHLNLKDKKVLDIGCNNGYFLFKMLQHKPQFLLGIEPTILNYMQFHFLKKLSSEVLNFHYAMGRQEELFFVEEFFDTIFSMGILYHHTSPIDQLKLLRKMLTRDGELFLETIIIPGGEAKAIIPEDRYAGMKNVWFLPTSSELIKWLKRCKFKDVTIIYQGKLEITEQRNTEWFPGPRPSLVDHLNQKNLDLTIEGHPAPHRIIIRAIKS